MFRPVDRPLSFRQRARDWIYKVSLNGKNAQWLANAEFSVAVVFAKWMLFLWSREPAPGPRAGPWFAWFATALVLWHFRRRVTKAILAVSPLRLLKKRNLLPLTTTKASSTATLGKQHHRLRQTNSILQRKHRHTGIRTKVKRLCTGDGPHMTSSTFTIPSQQIHYKVTRSGKVYGKYPNKAVAQANCSQGSH